jgi:hypothetical protein
MNLAERRANSQGRFLVLIAPDTSRPTPAADMYTESDAAPELKAENYVGLERV